MDKHERSDPTFPFVVVLVIIFVVTFGYVAFPRRDAPERPLDLSASVATTK
jgi:hypothetical protein